MIERLRLGSFGRRLAIAFLAGSLVSLAVLFTGVVAAHWLSRTEMDMLDAHWLFASLLVAILTAMVLSGAIARRLSGPIDGYIAMARAFAAGDLSARPPSAPPAEFADLTTALEAAAEEVERSGRARRQLTGDIAHELRTPLAALQAGLEELRDGYRDADETALAGLHAQACRMGRILDDLAALSAAESSRLHLRLARVDLQRIVDESLQVWSGALTAAGLRLESGPRGPVIEVVADPDRVHQMIGNLLANAAQYCRHGDRVKVSVGRTAGAGTVVVADSGEGLPPHELPMLFDRGWRSRRSTGAPGSGLGLPIVRALAIAQGGSAVARSSPSGGLELTIALPLAQDHRSIAAAIHPAKDYGCPAP